MSTSNRLDLETLGSQPLMPKNLPDHYTYHVGEWTFPPHSQFKPPTPNPNPQPSTSTSQYWMTI